MKKYSLLFLGLLAILCGSMTSCEKIKSASELANTTESNTTITDNSDIPSWEIPGGFVIGTWRGWYMELGNNTKHPLEIIVSDNLKDKSLQTSFSLDGSVAIQGTCSDNPLTTDLYQYAFNTEVDGKIYTFMNVGFDSPNDHPIMHGNYDISGTPGGTFSLEKIQ